MADIDRPRILLVDDEALLLVALVRLLRPEFDVLQAGSGEEALELMAVERGLSVIVSDQDMPGMSGHDLLKECARRYPTCTRIMLTGRGDLGLARSAIQQASIHRFLCKPCDFEELRASIRSGVQAHREIVERARHAQLLSRDNQELSRSNRDLDACVRSREESISVLRRLGLEMNRAEDLSEISRASAEACLKVLGGRGVCVQIHGPGGEGGQCCVGPEMSSRMISEALLTSEGPIGEITLDVLGPDGLELGPVEQNTLAAIASLTAVAGHNELRRRERDEAQYATVAALARLSERRDQETGQHLERVSAYCALIAESLAHRGVQRELITPRYVEDLRRSACLHDIGKVGIPDAILLKKGKLTAKEWEVMKTHAEIGAETLRSVTGGRHVPSYLAIGLDIALCHHEKWDGTGYPAGLVGEAIPLSARIMALADVYDALTSARPYKRAWSHGEALALIEEGRAAHFDPELVDAFLARADEADEIRASLADEACDPRHGLGPIARSA